VEAEVAAELAVEAAELAVELAAELAVELAVEAAELAVEAEVAVKEETTRRQSGLVSLPVPSNSWRFRSVVVATRKRGSGIFISPHVRHGVWAT
jgi:hypothetical protein